MRISDWSSDVCSSDLLADQLGVEPGAELRAALEAADAAGLPVLLIDREVGITLRRLTAAVPWWKRPGLIAGLMASLLTRERSEESRVGIEWVSTCRFRWWPVTLKQKTTTNYNT